MTSLSSRDWKVCWCWWLCNCFSRDLFFYLFRLFFFSFSFSFLQEEGREMRLRVMVDRKHTGSHHAEHDNTRGTCSLIAARWSLLQIACLFDARNRYDKNGCMLWKQQFWDHCKRDANRMPELHVSIETDFNQNPFPKEYQDGGNEWDFENIK